MSSRGDDDLRVKRKMTEPQDKQMPCRGHGRTIGAVAVQQAEMLPEIGDERSDDPG